MTVRVDSASVARLVRSIERAVRTEVPLRRGVDLLEARSVELAPVDTGNLEASFQSQEQRRGSKLVATFGFTPDYAAEVHELPDEARGPRTRRKRGNQYGPAGPRYLLRAMQGVVGDGSLGRVIARAYQEALDK